MGMSRIHGKTTHYAQIVADRKEEGELSTGITRRRGATETETQDVQSDSRVEGKCLFQGFA